MYAVNRCAIINDIELLVSGNLKVDRKDLPHFSLEIYKGILEIVLDALNNTGIKSLPDRVEMEFRHREMDPKVILLFIDLALDLAEKARSLFITMGVPFGAKYKLVLSPMKYVNLTDFIQIDFEETSKSLIGNKNDDYSDMDLLAEYSPSLEIINDAYERVERENKKINKNRFKSIP